VYITKAGKEQHYNFEYVKKQKEYIVMCDISGKHIKGYVFVYISLDQTSLPLDVYAI